VSETIEIEAKGLNFYYPGDIHVLKNINLPVFKNTVTALIGPSGCGKTTLLRCFNRMHDLYPKHRYEGRNTLEEGEHPQESDRYH
jgi:phosphate transport system ATP-binding protein